MAGVLEGRAVGHAVGTSEIAGIGKLDPQFAKGPSVRFLEWHLLELTDRRTIRPPERASQKDYALGAQCVLSLWNRR